MCEWASPNVLVISLPLGFTFWASSQWAYYHEQEKVLKDWKHYDIDEPYQLIGSLEREREKEREREEKKIESVMCDISKSAVCPTFFHVA
jgi:hypothetical protein